MPDEETLTQPDETESASTTDERPALEPPQEEQVADAPDASQGQEEAAEREEAPEPVELPEGWQDHGDVKAGLTSAREEAKEEGKREQQGLKDREIRELKVVQMEALQTTARDATSSAIVGSVVDAVSAFTKLAKAEGSTAAEVRSQLEEILSENASWAAAFDGAARTESEQTGRNAGLTHSSQLLQGGLNKEDTAKFADFTRDLNTSVRLREITWDQAFGKGLAFRDGLIRDSEATKLEKLTTERQAEETRATERNGQKPAAKVAGRSGGEKTSTANDVLQSSTSSAEEKLAAFQEKHGFAAPLKFLT